MGANQSPALSPPAHCPPSAIRLLFAANAPRFNHPVFKLPAQWPLGLPDGVQRAYLSLDIVGCWLWSIVVVHGVATIPVCHCVTHRRLADSSPASLPRSVRPLPGRRNELMVHCGLLVAEFQGNFHEIQSCTITLLPAHLLTAAKGFLGDADPAEQSSPAPPPTPLYDLESLEFLSIDPIAGGPERDPPPTQKTLPAFRNSQLSQRLEPTPWQICHGVGPCLCYRLFSFTRMVWLQALICRPANYRNTPSALSLSLGRSFCPEPAIPRLSARLNEYRNRVSALSHTFSAGHDGHDWTVTRVSLLLEYRNRVSALSHTNHPGQALSGHDILPLKVEAGVPGWRGWRQ